MLTYASQRNELESAVYSAVGAAYAKQEKASEAPSKAPMSVYRLSKAPMSDASSTYLAVH